MGCVGCGQNSTTSHCRWGRSHASILLERRAGGPSQTSVAFWIAHLGEHDDQALGFVARRCSRTAGADRDAAVLAYWLPIPAVGGVATSCSAAATTRPGTVVATV